MDKDKDKDTNTPPAADPRTMQVRQPKLDELPILRYFSYEHLPAGVLWRVSSDCAELAHNMALSAAMAQERGEFVDVAELVAGLRKLLEAKDCFVRARLPR